MTTATTPRPRAGPRFGFGLAAAAIVGLPAGLYGTALSPLTVWIVGGLVVVTGGIGAALRSCWGVLLLVIGGALLLGSAAYVVLGLSQPDGPVCGGTGCAVGA